MLTVQAVFLEYAGWWRPCSWFRSFIVLNYLKRPKNKMSHSTGCSILQGDEINQHSEPSPQFETQSETFLFHVRFCRKGRGEQFTDHRFSKTSCFWVIPFNLVITLKPEQGFPCMPNSKVGRLYVIDRRLRRNFRLFFFICQKSGAFYQRLLWCTHTECGGSTGM